MSYSIQNIEEFYVLGIPIKTDLGDCHFLKVKDYPNFFMDLQILSLSKWHVLSEYRKVNKDPEFEKILDEMEKLDLFYLVTSVPELLNSYTKIFEKVYREKDAFYSIESAESFDFHRELIMRMNVVKEEKVNPNPEIQKAIERSQRLKNQNAEKLTFADIVTSIVGYNGLSYSDINEFTIYQLYMTYYRIAQLKNYDTTTLFATVSTEKVEIEDWSKNIDLFEEEEHFVSKKEFDRTVGSVLDS